MLRANKWAVTGGISKNPNVTSGPTLNTAIEIVRPMTRKSIPSHKSTFFLRVMAISRSKDTSMNSF